ncbi:MAG TPA: Ig-like domain-containing protein, partial [Verrucomicrobiae bacterium]|nr:Ig-like domain-containing protein [Verrucomicrobiae bacterium]
MRIDRIFLALFGFCALAASLEVRAEVKLIVPAGYLPGVPFLARVEVRDGTGARNRNLWDAEATLTSDQAGVSLSTNRVTLRNGLGTALLTINGNSDFTLRAQVNQEQAARTISNRSGQPVTTMSGTLTGTSSTWSGIIKLTGTVTIPAGHTLTIDSNAMVLIDGTASGTAGINLVVRGALRSLGTELFPVVITCSDASLNWGQLRHESSAASLYQYTFISRAGRAAGEGHTGSAPAIKTDNSTLDFESSVVSDFYSGATAIGKIMMASGSSLTFNDSVLARARMGPEIASTGLLFTNSYIMEMRGPDDADGIYLHDAGARPLLLSGSVMVGGDDDAVDTLDSNVTVENCILRDWPNPNEDAKGLSGFNGEIVLRRCLIANCYAGVSTKSSGPLSVLRLDHCTITALERGVSAATKANASAGNINIFITNSVVLAADAIYSDFGPEKFVSVTYSDFSETWPGVGNLSVDPLFVNRAAGDFHLQSGSPLIDAGDPGSPPDQNGSRTDIGFFTGLSQSSGLFVSVTAPANGSVFTPPATIVLTASANSPAGAVSGVEFYNGNTRLGSDADSPYSYTWSNVGVGSYSLRAVAAAQGGILATSAPVSISVAVPSEEPPTNILVRSGSDWRFLDDGSDQGTAWKEENFADRAWKIGKAELGYGDGDERTVLGFGPSSGDKYVTYYFRQAFSVEDAARIQALNINLLRDDGAIVY